MKLRSNEAQALDAFSRGRYDIEAFAREVLGIEPNAAQRRWFRYINPARGGWQWRYKVVVHVAANQCLADGEFLYTPSGIVPVADAVAGTETVDGRVTNVPFSFEDELYEVRFTNGLRMRVNGRR